MSLIISLLPKLLFTDQLKIIKLSYQVSPIVAIEKTFIARDFKEINNYPKAYDKGFNNLI